MGWDAQVEPNLQTLVGNAVTTSEDVTESTEAHAPSKLQYNSSKSGSIRNRQICNTLRALSSTS